MKARAGSSKGEQSQLVTSFRGDYDIDSGTNGRYARFRRMVRVETKERTFIVEGMGTDKPILSSTYRTSTRLPRVGGRKQGATEFG